MFDLSERNLNDFYECFSRELNHLHNSIKTEQDAKLRRTLQTKIIIVNTMLTNIVKFKTMETGK